jgi:hypothetical protein
MPPGLDGVVRQTEGGKKVVTPRRSFGAGDQQLLPVARTICLLKYGRRFRASTVYSEFSTARIMRQIDVRWPGDYSDALRVSIRMGRGVA